jgi:hypothetical protein
MWRTYIGFEEGRLRERKPSREKEYGQSKTEVREKMALFRVHWRVSCSLDSMFLFHPITNERFP